MKSYYCKNNNNLPSHVSRYLGHLFCKFHRTECSIYQNVQHFIRSKPDVSSFTTVRYSLSQVQRNDTTPKINNSPFTLSPVCVWTGDRESWNQFSRSGSVLNLVNFLLWELCHKNYIVARSEISIFWSAFGSRYIAWSDKSRRNKRDSRTTARRAASVFLLTCWCS